MTKLEIILEIKKYLVSKFFINNNKYINANHFRSESILIQKIHNLTSNMTLQTKQAKTQSTQEPKKHQIIKRIHSKGFKNQLEKKIEAVRDFAEIQYQTFACIKVQILNFVIKTLVVN